MNTVSHMNSNNNNGTNTVGNAPVGTGVCYASGGVRYTPLGNRSSVSHLGSSPSDALAFECDGVNKMRRTGHSYGGLCASDVHTSLPPSQWPVLDLVDPSGVQPVELTDGYPSPFSCSSSNLWDLTDAFKADASHGEVEVVCISVDRDGDDTPVKFDLDDCSPYTGKVNLAPNDLSVNTDQLTEVGFATVRPVLNENDAAVITRDSTHGGYFRTFQVGEPPVVRIRDGASSYLRGRSPALDDAIRLMRESVIPVHAFMPPVKQGKRAVVKALNDYQSMVIGRVKTWARKLKDLSCAELNMDQFEWIAWDILKATSPKMSRRDLFEGRFQHLG